MTRRELHQRRSANSWRATDVVIVANRLPVERRPDGTLGRSPGGLASALAAVSDENTQWIGWAGEAGDDGPVEIDDPHLHAVELRPKEVTDYYRGFSNSLLWPLFHGRLRQPQINRSWWRSYQAVNERYADTVARVAPLNGLVWVHDYHLLLTPAMIRARRPDLRVGHFLHIPFPSIELFATLPWRGDLVRGMSGADLIGFQTERDAANAAAAIEEFGAERRPSSKVPSVAGSADVDTFPISIDFEQWNGLGVEAHDTALRHRDASKVDFIFLGVDRLDYTKGIDQRLRAFRELLDDGLLDPGSCTFVQVSVPSREGIADYSDERDEVERLVDETNTRHRRLDGGGPIHHITAQLDERDLAGWYRAADCLVVTSYADGMNLVAKEFVACRGDLGASIVLSEFAGAAHELPGALIVNPYDIDAVKQSLVTARRMSAIERADRMRTMRDQVREHDVHAWAYAFLRRLARSRLRSVDVTADARQGRRAGGRTSTGDS